MYYTTLCAIVKDEDKDIHEWLLYHFSIGFEHILIYDNNSSVPLKTILKEFIENGLVTLIEFPLTKAQQLSAYIHALKNWRDKTIWLGFIDIDEFIYPTEDNDIRDFLDSYIEYGGLGINWAMFSSNGHIGRPQGGILQNYTKCLGIFPHIKSIVRPSVVQRPISPHHFLFVGNHYCVNEDHIPILGFNSYPLANKIRINHYYYKSQQDWEMKMNRGLATQIINNAERKIDDFYLHLSKKTFHDNSILRFQPLLNKLAELPIKKLSYIIKASIEPNLEDELSKINNYIKNNEFSSAYKIIKNLNRYYNSVDIKLMEANLLLLLNKLDEGLGIVSREMTKPGITENTILSCYKIIKNYYQILGKNNIADSINNMT